MHKLILSFALTICVNSLIKAQVQTTFYYNQSWQLTTKDSAVFYRKCVYDTISDFFGGEVKDYSASGSLLMRGYYKDRKKTGNFVFYHPNKKVAITGAFENNKRTGVWKYFYPNGNLRHEIEIMNATPRVITYKDSIGNALLIDGTGPWREEYIEGNVNVIIEGNFKQWQKDGEWNCYLSDGRKIYREKYKNGRLTEGVNLQTKEVYQSLSVQNHLLIPFSIEAAEKLFQAESLPANYYQLLVQNTKEDRMEEPAKPSCGMPEFYRIIATAMRYPPEAKKKRVEGRVFVEFVINQDGSLSDLKVIRGLGNGCDEEAIWAVKAASKKCQWIPGMQKNRPVKSKFNMAIVFKLN